MSDLSQGNKALLEMFKAVELYRKVAEKCEVVPARNHSYIDCSDISDEQAKEIINQLDWDLMNHYMSEDRSLTLADKLITIVFNKLDSKRFWFRLQKKQAELKQS